MTYLPILSFPALLIEKLRFIVLISATDLNLNALQSSLIASTLTGL